MQMRKRERRSCWLRRDDTKPSGYPYIHEIERRCTLSLAISAMYGGLFDTKVFTLSLNHNDPI
jgi:hypothetical protein